MPNQETIGTYVLDTLQIYFPWDDDLYTYVKNKGFGQSGFCKKALPLIYSDNCQSTGNTLERARKYVLNPKYFGQSFESLGWKKTEKETEPIIGAEKPRLTVSLIGDELKFKVIPNTNGREEYHIEYSSMAAFGRMYSNWAIPVLTSKDFKGLLNNLENRGLITDNDFTWVDIQVQKKQKQRELMYFAEVPIESYKFSMGEFFYAKEFLKQNGYFGVAPSLIFKNEKKYLEVMKPVLKLGFIHTDESQGFERRSPQFALKISQEKISENLRGKRGKAKGLITEDPIFENYFMVPAGKFACAAKLIVSKFAT